MIWFGSFKLVCELANQMFVSAAILDLLQSRRFLGVYLNNFCYVRIFFYPFMFYLTLLLAIFILHSVLLSLRLFQDDSVHIPFLWNYLSYVSVGSQQKFDRSLQPLFSGFLLCPSLLPIVLSLYSLIKCGHFPLI